MYRIKYNIFRNIYQIHSTFNGAFEGTLERITIKAIEMGLDQEELTTAFNEMSKNRHTVAEFGINGYFIFSRNENEEDFS